MDFYWSDTKDQAEWVKAQLPMIQECIEGTIILDHTMRYYYKIVHNGTPYWKAPGDKYLDDEQMAGQAIIAILNPRVVEQGTYVETLPYTIREEMDDEQDPWFGLPGFYSAEGWRPSSSS